MDAKAPIEKIIFIHFFYWLLVVLGFTLIWGSYDGDFARSLMVQITSLPARFLLSYGLLLVLIPRYYRMQQFGLFGLSGVTLLVISVLVVQRPIIIFFVEGRFLPYQSPEFFNLIALVNTSIDVLVPAIPLLFVHDAFMQKWGRSNTVFGQEPNDKSTSLNGSFLLKEGKSAHLVSYSDILFIESRRNQLITVTKDQSITSYGNMASMEALLPAEWFVKIHRSFIVNIREVDAFSKREIKMGSHTLPISRTYKDEVSHLFPKLK